MKKLLFLLMITVALLAGNQSFAQKGVAINNTGADPDNSAILDLSSTTKGFLPPRMTYAQKIAITSPPAGLMVWCTNCGTHGELQVFNGDAWTNLIGGAALGIVPGAPTIGTAIAGDGQASVSYTAPASNGGSTITSYMATSDPGNITGILNQAGSGTITVTGLTNGTAYTFTVTATNVNGSGAASTASNSVTPDILPGAPTGVSATPGNAQASVSFTAPASNGGSTITSYMATSDPGNITGILNQAESGTITVTGLTNGTAYTFTVKATNAMGIGAVSDPSNTVTPATVPDAPIIGTATAGAGQASVSFTEPVSNGGSTITSYTATSNPGNFTGTLSQAGSGTITVTGLTNGTAYTFTVTATNANGISAASDPSNTVTPANVPGAPTIGTAVAGNTQASVPFTAPASNGGSTITSYTATSSPDGITKTLTQEGSGTITVTGLTNGTAYTFTVTATNAIGIGAASDPSNTVTPATVPGAPTIGTAVSGPAQATVTFTAPSSNGGSTITSYTATSSPGGITKTLTQEGSGTITVTGLTNGTAYTFTVAATNAVGTGAASAASNSVTPVALYIGQSYGGGIIAYIDDSGQHGLIAATADQSTGIAWAISPYLTTAVPGGTSVGLGTGLANTNKIIAQNGAGTNYAAGLARAYNGGGFNDWYLPSSGDLFKLLELKDKYRLGNFLLQKYWSSSELDAEQVIYIDFNNYYGSLVSKYYPSCYVRAVRSF